MKNWIGASLLGLLVISTVATARPHWGPDGGFAFLDIMAEQLGLTEQQEASIDELISSSRLESAVDREKIVQVREQLRDLSRTPGSFDQGAAENLASEMAEIVARMAVSGAELRWQVRQVLSDEQREQLDKWQPRHHMRMHAPDAEF